MYFSIPFHWPTAYHTTWPANNCLKTMVCSCDRLSKCVLLQIMICSCVKHAWVLCEKWHSGDPFLSILRILEFLANQICPIWRAVRGSRTSGVGPDQRSRFLVLTKGSAATEYENRKMVNRFPELLENCYFRRSAAFFLSSYHGGSPTPGW